MNPFTRNQTRERMKNKKTGELDHDKSTPAIPLCTANLVSSKTTPFAEISFRVGKSSCLVPA